MTLQLRNEIIARALDAATRSQRNLEDILVEWLDQYADDLPVESLSDEEVLALCNFEMNPVYQYELRDLLMSHRERTLTDTESTRLDELLQIHRKGIIRKSRAIEVAAARGLRHRTTG